LVDLHLQLIVWNAGLGGGVAEAGWELEAWDCLQANQGAKIERTDLASV